MKNENRPAPSDDDIADLLKRRYRDTSHEFEARWVALKRDLRQQPAPRARSVWVRPWTGWLGAMGAAAAVVLVVHFNRMPAPPPAGTAPVLTLQLTELFAMNDVLTRATPLLDPENRAVLLHLPAPDQP